MSKKLLLFGLASASIAAFDISNLDWLLHKSICKLVPNLLPAVCVAYYDLPFWEVIVSLGTISAAVFAYLSIEQSNRFQEKTQMPIVISEEGDLYPETGEVRLIVENVGQQIANSFKAFLVGNKKKVLLEINYSIDVDRPRVITNNHSDEGAKNRMRQVSEILKNKTAKYILLEYKDIYMNSYLTKCFIQYDLDHYIIQRSGWEFKEA